jgi:predicted metal-dependent peptidase
LSNIDRFANTLYRFGDIFYALYSMGRMVPSEEVDTAAIAFDPMSGQPLTFLYNPEYWNTIDDYTKQFIVCHEMLHVILKHGIRAKDVLSKPKTNYALDVAVNHTLVEVYGFIRERVNGHEKLCWVDTVFKGHPNVENIPTNQTFEYYYSMMPEDPEGGKNGEYKIVEDGHGGLGGITAEDVQDMLSDCQINEDDAEKLKEAMNRDGMDKAAIGIGKDQGNSVTIIPKLQKVRWSTWENVVRRWTKKYRNKGKELNWIKENRRTSSLGKEFMLPSYSKLNGKELCKTDVFVYLDTSGSCRNYAHPFMAMADSIPKDKFDIKLFCFDTKVYPTDLKTRQLYGFGGTAFHIIENHIQSELKKGKIRKYPGAVFVVTDGYGTQVNMQHPDRWYWFLTPRSTDGYYPSDCHTHKMNNSDMEIFQRTGKKSIFRDG